METNDVIWTWRYVESSVTLFGDVIGHSIYETLSSLSYYLFYFRELTPYRIWYPLLRVYEMMMGSGIPLTSLVVWLASGRAAGIWISFDSIGLLTRGSMLNLHNRLLKEDIRHSVSIIQRSASSGYICRLRIWTVWLLAGLLAAAHTSRRL